MAGRSTLSVEVTAELAGFQARMAQARAEVNAWTAAVREGAQADAAAGNAAGTFSDATLQAGLNLQRARASLAGLNSEAQRTPGMLTQVGQAAEGAHSGFSGVLRESRALFDELSSGRTKQSPGTMLLLAQRIYSISPAAVGATAGIGALAVGIGVLIERALAARDALNSAFAGAQFAGNLSLTKDALAQLTAQMTQASNVSSSDAQKITESLARIPGMTTQALQAVGNLVPTLLQEMGGDAEKLGALLQKAFAPDQTAAAIAKSLEGTTQFSTALLAQARAADESGQASQATALKIQMLLGPVMQSTAAFAEQNRVAHSFMDTMYAASAAAEGDASMEEAKAAFASRYTEEIKKRTAATQQLLEVIRQQQNTPQQTLQVGMQVATSENPVALQVDEAQAKVRELTSALQVAQSQGDQVDVRILNSGLEKARENLQNLQFGPVLERMREQMQQLAATWDGTQSGMLAKQIQIAQQMLPLTQGNAQQRLQVESEVARLTVQQQRAAGEEAIAAAREQIAQQGSAVQQGASERIAAEAAAWNQVLANDRLTAAQRVEVQRSLNQSLSALARESATEQRQIAQIDAQGAISVAQMDLQAKKEALDEDLAAHRITAAQRLAMARELAQQETALAIQSLDAQRAAAAGLPVDQARIDQQIFEQKARLNLELTTLDRQYQTQSAAATRQQGTAWKGVVSEIEGAESGFVSNILSGRKTLAQSVGQLALQMAEREITADLKAMTTKLLLGKAQQTQEMAMEQGGLLFHLASEAQKTGATGAAVGARTSAVVAGNAAQTASTVSAAAAGKAASATEGRSTIMQDAAKAFSGTYASVSSIPVVGWILAPIAAATAFAAVAAYEGMASLDVGAYDVPHDMVAQIHQGEMVVPKTFAQGMRDGGGAGLGGGGYHEEHHHGPVQINAFDSRSVARMLSRSGTRGALFAAAGRHVRRGGRF